jgi:hypothetical protein
VFIGPLLINGRPSVACVRFTEMCLPCRCLAMGIHVAMFKDRFPKYFLYQKRNFCCLESHAGRALLRPVEDLDIEDVCLITVHACVRPRSDPSCETEKRIRALHCSDNRIHTPGRVFRLAGYIDAINRRTDTLQDKREETCEKEAPNWKGLLLG